jgi:hypothetical protein
MRALQMKLKILCSPAGEKSALAQRFLIKFLALGCNLLE